MTFPRNQAAGHERSPTVLGSESVAPTIVNQAGFYGGREQRLGHKTERTIALLLASSVNIKHARPFHVLNRGVPEGERPT